MSDKYDFADWKPVTPQRYAELVGEAARTDDELSEMKTTVETLPDCRVRVVLHASVRRRSDDGSVVSGVEPYLSVLHDDETGRSVCFVRQIALSRE